MNEKTKLLAGILVFGSLWGFSECIIGPALGDAGLPSGAIMTGFFAMIFLTMSRLFYKQRGMQIGMGLVAGSLRFFNPLGGCQVCSAIAIAAEGLLFELIFNYLSELDLNKMKTLTTKASLGIFTSYSVYVGGYIITQILTPLSFGSFYVENLISFLPVILASGLLAALIGGITIPATMELGKIDFKLADRFYYPTTLGVSAICWIVVLGTWLTLGA